MVRPVPCPKEKKKSMIVVFLKMVRTVDSFLIPSTKAVLLQKHCGEKSQLAEDVFSRGLLPCSYCKRQQNWPSDGDRQSVSRWVLLSILPGVANLVQQGDKCLGEVITVSVYFAPPATFLQRKCFLLKHPVYLLRHLDNLPSLETYGRCRGHICRPVFAEVMSCGTISLEEL